MELAIGIIAIVGTIALTFLIGNVMGFHEGRRREAALHEGRIIP